MKRSFTAVVGASMLLWLLGCASPRANYDDAKLSQITKDTTTEAQLVEWFGAPQSRSLDPDGSKRLTWRFGNGAHSGTAGKLDVQLARNGTVNAYSGSTNAR